MAKKMEKVIQEAKSKGISVRYRKVKEDGWTRIRVISIDGEAFPKSKGNIELRRRMGESLSAGEVRSRKEANVGAEGVSSASGYQRARHKKLTRGTPKLTKVERREIARVNRQVKKLGSGTKMSYRGARLLKAKMGRGAVVNEAKRHYIRNLGLATVYTIENFRSALKGTEARLRPDAIPMREVIKKVESLLYFRYGRVYARKHKAIKDDDLMIAWRMMYHYEDKTNKEEQDIKTAVLTFLDAKIIEI